MSPGSLPAGFVGPWWLERQRDPQGPDFEPAPVGGDIDVTHRNAVLVGNLDRPERAAVDPRGLVTVAAGCSIDWWIGSDERWHVPSREPAVRQELLEGAPVIITAMRVPGGDVLHRVFAVEASGPSRTPAVVVEIENASPVPVALALAVRPYDHSGVGGISEIDLVDDAVVVDGRTVLEFGRAPSRFSVGSLARGDSADVVLRGAATDQPPEAVSCPDGLAQAAYVFPLPHTAVLRARIPLGVADPERQATTASPADPKAEAVAKGWEAHADRGARLVLPDAGLSEAVGAAQRALLLALVGGGGLVEGLGAEARHDVVVALDLLGFGDEAESIVLGLAEECGSDGYVGGDRHDAIAAHAGVLNVMARHVQVTGEEELAAALAETCSAAGLWLERHTGPTGRLLGLRRRSKEAHLDGLVGLSDPPTFRDQFWALAGLRGLAHLFRLGGHAEAAIDATAAEDALRRAVAGACDASLGTQRLLPATVGGGFDVDSVENLVAHELGVTTEADASWVRRLRRRFESGPEGLGVLDAEGRGLRPRATIRLLRAEAIAGDAGALAPRLRWLVGAAHLPGWWPTVVNPRTGGGSGGAPADLGVAAAFLLFLRDLVARDHGSGIDLVSALPATWLGKGLEVHDAPTRFGRLGFAVRWHGERPAILWELHPHGAPTGSFELRAPGLDPSWRSGETSGEALLAPVRPPATDGEGVDGDPPSPGGEAAGEATGVRLRVGTPTRRHRETRDDRGRET